MTSAIGKALRVLREERGLSVRDLADKVGIHWTNVAAKERGDSRIRPPERRKFAEALGLSLEAFDAVWRASKVDQSKGDEGIPVINRAPAGLVVDYEEYGVDSGQGFEYIERGTVEDPHAFAVVVVGESMEPALFGGDYVVFSPVARVPRPRAELKAGSICFVRLSADGKTPGCSIARFKEADGSKMVFSKDNKKHKGISVDRELVEQLAVAVELRRKLV